MSRRRFPHPRAEDCEPPDPADTVTTRLNNLLKSSGPGYILRLCPSQKYLIQAPIVFVAPNQEISTLGYPTGDDRATLVVDGPVFANGTGHTNAVTGSCQNCSGAQIRNIQINGSRLGAPPLPGGGNIEMGGENVTNQLIEYVHSYDPRGWSCLHVTEGSDNCRNSTVQYNDIGPCGTDTFQQWADGISMACRESVVRHNMIHGATDGGIVLFGAPGTQVYNNTIWVGNHTQLGGINMVDLEPFDGNYTGTVVRNNTILGGFATEKGNPGDKEGVNSYDVIMKIGIAVGPRTWFGTKFANNFTYSGLITDNNFGGAFSWAIAVSSARNFTIQNNVLIGNTSFIDAIGPNCTKGRPPPNPAPFVVDPSLTQGLTLQSNFQTVNNNNNSLVCVEPPDEGDYWPFGTTPSSGTSPGPGSTKLTAGQKAGIAIGVILGVIALAIALWFVRKRSIRKYRAKGAVGLIQLPPKFQ